MANPPPLDMAIAAVDYAFPWDRLVTQMKFNAALDLAGLLAALLRDAVARSGNDEVDLVLPVPLAPERLRERGFNQAWELARRIARGSSAKADARVLIRVKDSPHQLALPRDQRAGNVRGVFAIEPSRVAMLSGRKVALVDDVMTTGATLAELASVLKRAGALRVQAWVVARTPRNGPPPSA